MNDEVPQKGEDGIWRVNGREFQSQASAYYWLDRQRAEPVSRAEDVSDWIFRKSLDVSR